MRVESIFISDIVVGERRREEFGDLEGLAESVNRLGLLQPVVVDFDGDKYRLNAGERRLRACRDILGWLEIPARLFSDLTEDERREIELEENTRRKDLTPYELSRNLVALAETAAKVIEREFPLTDSEKSEPKRGRPEKKASKDKVAERLGINRQTITNATEHVAAVEKYPELAVIIPTQKDTITVAKNLDKLPERERSEARSKLMNHDQPTLARLAEKPPMPPSKPKIKSAGGKWRDNLSEIRVFLQSIKALGGGAEMTATWTEQERHTFLAELWEFSGELNELIKELEGVENELKQRAG